MLRLCRICWNEVLREPIPAVLQFTPENGGDSCARTGRVGQAQRETTVLHRSHRANTKQAPSRHRERMRTANARWLRSVSGRSSYHQARRGSASPDANDGKKDGRNIATVLKYTYESFLEE